jgi:hypothetical protein
MVRFSPSLDGRVRGGCDLHLHLTSPVKGEENTNTDASKECQVTFEIEKP